jgi:hypothetical protein
MEFMMRKNSKKNFINHRLSLYILLGVLNLFTGCIAKNQIVVTFAGKVTSSPVGDDQVATSSDYTYAFGVTQSTKLVLNKIENSTGVATQVAIYNLPGSIGAFELSKNKTRIFVQVNNSNLYLYGIDKTTNPPTLNLLSSATATFTGNASDLWGVCAAPDGTSAHIVQYGTTKLYSFKVDGSDVVSFVGVNTQAPNYLTNCKVTADSKYLISVGYYANAVSFSINSSTKALTKIIGVSAGNGPSWVEQSEDSQFFFVPAQNESLVSAFEMDLSTGSFTLVDTLMMAGVYPDYLDVKANGTKIYVNGQGGNVYYVPFNRTTKKFGSATSVSNIIEWFTLDKLGPFYFQNQGSNTNIYFLNEDGTLGSQGSTLSNQSGFKTLSL